MISIVKVDKWTNNNIGNIIFDQIVFKCWKDKYLKVNHNQHNVFSGIENAIFPEISRENLHSVIKVIFLGLT